MEHCEHFKFDCSFHLPSFIQEGKATGSGILTCCILSELSDSIPIEDEYSDSVASLALNNKKSSPQLVVTPHSSQNKKSTRSAKKTTPVRSQYFHPDVGSQSDEQEDEDSTEQEVVKPRMTTARTRARR